MVIGLYLSRTTVHCAQEAITVGYRVIGVAARCNDALFVQRQKHL